MLMLMFLRFTMLTGRNDLKLVSRPPEVPSRDVPGWWGVVSRRWLSELSAISIMPHRPHQPALELRGHLGLYSHQPWKLLVDCPKAVLEKSWGCGDVPASYVLTTYCYSQPVGQLVIFSCPEQLNRWPCHSLTNSGYFTNWHTKSDPRDLWLLRHLIRVMRKHDLTKKKDNDNDKYKNKDNDKDKYI